MAVNHMIHSLASASTRRASGTAGKVTMLHVTRRRATAAAVAAGENLTTKSVPDTKAGAAVRVVEAELDVVAGGDGLALDER